MEDLKLISRVLVFGDKRAYESLVVKYQSSVRRFLLHLSGGDKMLSDDLAQEAFVKAYLQLGSFRSMAKFSTWITGIAYHLYIDHYRKQQREQEYISENATFAKGFTSADKFDAIHDVEVALQGLSPSERAVVLLFYIDDMEIKNICDTLKMPAGSVKSHLHRAKNKMKNFFENERNIWLQ
ncbi:MAG: RNA polymerase sigma factor [Bacteroidales bacterium]|nr:RNA polymerase sigma factor [Bacteroidales bacterium]